MKNCLHSRGKIRPSRLCMVLCICARLHLQFHVNPELKVLCLHSKADELYKILPMQILAACHPVDMLAACQHQYLFTYTTHIPSFLGREI